MGVRAAEIAVYAVSRLQSTPGTFWIGPTEDILAIHPWLGSPHKQSFYMLLCLGSAKGKVVLDQQIIRIEASMIVCVRPNSVFHLDIDNPSKGIIIAFTEAFFSLRYNNNVLYRFGFLHKDAHSSIRLPPAQWEKCSSLLRFMQEEFDRAQPAADKVLRSYLNVLLFEIDRVFHPLQKLPADAGEEKVIRFEQLMEAHYAQHKTPSFYAAGLNITTNYLNKLCRLHRGNTSGEIIRRRVTIEAQRLLHYTTLSVAEIGYQLGFESSSYFITFFKKQTDTTPESFRKGDR